MKIVRVKLMGTLSANLPGQYSREGIELALPEDATVGTLVEAIGLNRDLVAIVTINGTIAKAADPVPAGAVVKLLQPVTGG